MSLVHHVTSAHAKAHCGAAEPVPQGLQALQARLVDNIKRAAIRHLHASERGEHMLLSMYHDAEAASEGIFREQLTDAPPEWLARQLTQHLAEEQAHTALYASACVVRAACQPAKRVPEGLSRRKLARWRRLAARHARHFTQGSLVPLYATLLCAEQMGVRILQRHCETIGQLHALHPLFAGVLADEQRHVRLCAHTLQRLVSADETAHLAALLADIRKVGAAFGVCGALSLYAAGLLLRALPAADAG